LQAKGPPPPRPHSNGIPAYPHPPSTPHGPRPMRRNTHRPRGFKVKPSFFLYRWPPLCSSSMRISSTKLTPPLYFCCIFLLHVLVRVVACGVVLCRVCVCVASFSLTCVCVCGAFVFCECVCFPFLVQVATPCSSSTRSSSTTKLTPPLYFCYIFLLNVLVRVVVCGVVLVMCVCVCGLFLCDVCVCVWRNRLAWPHRRRGLASDGVRYAGARSSVGRRFRSATKLRLEWYGGVFLLLQQRSKHLHLKRQLHFFVSESLSLFLYR